MLSGRCRGMRGFAMAILVLGATSVSLAGQTAAPATLTLQEAIELARQAELQQTAATGTDDFRAVAPPVMNFGAGRSR